MLEYNYFFNYRIQSYIDFYLYVVSIYIYIYFIRDRRGHDRMLVGIITTCAISAYRH